MNKNSKLSEIIVRCWSDDKFKETFKSNPQKVFEEYGIEINKNASKINIVENTTEESYFVLPEKPDSLRFNETELKAYVEELYAVQLVLTTILGD